MDNKYLQILKQGSNQWWNTFLTVRITINKRRTTREELTQNSLRDIFLANKIFKNTPCEY